MNHPELVSAQWLGSSDSDAKVGQFRGVAISNYFVWDQDSYDYTVSALNDLCRSTVEMSVKGWPGGLRWLHGEDEG